MDQNSSTEFQSCDSYWYFIDYSIKMRFLKLNCTYGNCLNEERWGLGKSESG